MSILYVYGGDIDKVVSEDSSKKVFSYCLGTGNVKGGVINLNDSQRLNAIAKESCERYSEFVYKQNQIFIKNGLVIDDSLSLYFLTDFACKRTELFSTYSDFCNSKLVSEICKNQQISHLVFDMCAPSLVEAVSSTVPDLRIDIRFPVRPRNKVGKEWVKTLFYYCKVIFISSVFLPLFNLKNRKINKYTGDLFLTRFPLHLNHDLYEDKYGSLVREDQRYLAHLLTDGLHQNPSVKEFFESLCFLIRYKNIYILDMYLRFSDAIMSFFDFLIVFSRIRKVTRGMFIHEGVDLSLNIKRELSFSLLRVPRLLLWRKALERFLKQNAVVNFYYYLHEYSYGRFFTYTIKNYSPLVRLIGFQHGPVSSRKLVCMAARGELEAEADGIKAFPIPNEILAEDSYSASIYRKAGYENVRVMAKIYRLEYLRKIKSQVRQKLYLIAPGLHDGEFLFNSLIEEITGNHGVVFVVKPHPRANNRYVERCRSFGNVRVSYKPVYELLPQAARVYATYSSVAVEARMLGIDVRLINLPGKINESPLLDTHFCASLEHQRR